MIEDNYDLIGKPICTVTLLLAIADEDQVPDDEEGVIDKTERCSQSQQVSNAQPLTLLTVCTVEHINDKRR